MTTFRIVKHPASNCLHRGWKNQHRIILQTTRPTSPVYLTCDPTDLTPKLEKSGCKQVETNYNRAGNQAFITGVWPELHTNEDYVASFKIACDHTGTRSVRIAPGTLRISCYNQFLGECVKIHHCSTEMRKFLENPMPFVLKALQRKFVKLSSRIESFKGVEGGDRLIAALKLGRRLHFKAVEYYTRYIQYDGRTVWAVLQGLSDPDCGSPTLRQYVTQWIEHPDRVYRLLQA